MSPAPEQPLTWGDERVGGSGGGGAGQGMGAALVPLSLFEVLGGGVGQGPPGGASPGRGTPRGLHGQGREVGAGGAQGQALHLQQQWVRGARADFGGLAGVGRLT